MENKFFNKSDQIAVIGVSQNPKKFGHQVYSFLKKNNYRVIPVNPKAALILEDVCFNSIASIPDTVEKAVLITPKTETDGVLKELSVKGIKNIWVQQMSQTKESKALAESMGMNAVFNRCALMYAEPVKGIHAFHKWLWKVFGLTKQPAS